MATGFDISEFLLNPTYESLISCTRSMLFNIAAKLGVEYPKQILKRDLQNLIMEELEEQGLVTRLERPATGTVEDEGILLKEKTPPAREAGSAPETPVTLPKYEPLSRGSSDSLCEAKLKVRLARLQMEIEDRAQVREAKLQLDIKRLEIEADKAVRLRELELVSHRDAHAGFPTSATTSASPLPGPAPPAFDVSRQIALVPPFKETDVDSYFATFEQIATTLQWPGEVWPLLLQCKLFGKAQDAVAALAVEDSLNYELVKAAVLRAYELVPEAYRQKF